MIDILTVHYNQPEMLECLIRSLNRHTDCTIHVFENSDEYPYKGNHPNVKILDNSKGQIVDFDGWLKQFPERRTSARANFGSAKHCKSIDVCFDLLPNGFILMDSDVLVKKDVSELWDDDYAWVGEATWETHEGVRVMRLLPFLCYINVPLLRKKGIKYFNGNWMWHLRPTNPHKYYDTGAWFLKTCTENALPHKQTAINPYIEHYGHGSHVFLNESLGEWLEERRALWQR